jgi:hypothetical protein
VRPDLETHPFAETLREKYNLPSNPRMHSRNIKFLLPIMQRECLRIDKSISARKQHQLLAAFGMAVVDGGKEEWITQLAFL